MARLTPAATALAASLVTVGAVAALIGHSYITDHFRYPLGWDSGFYVWRTQAVTFDGLGQIGTIRPVFPVLAAVLMRLTDQNAWTIVALLPALLAGITALAGVATVRAALRVDTRWVPVIGFLMWAAFVSNEIPLHHYDNLVNADLILGGFAAAIAFAGDGRGALAAGGLFAVAGLAHWPFYLVAMAVYGLGLALFALPRLHELRRQPRLGVLGPLTGAGVASAAATGLSLLGRPPSGWLGADPGAVRSLLAERLTARLRRPLQFATYPFGALGALLTARSGCRRRPEVALFLSLATAWAGVTLVSILAQLIGVPTAGARVLSFFFPATILTGVLVWRLATTASSLVRGAAGWAGGGLIVLCAVGAFGYFSWTSWSNHHPWFEPQAVQQAASAGAYLQRQAPGREVVFLLDMSPRRDFTTIGRWWTDVKAALPPDVELLAHRYIGTPQNYLARRPSLELATGAPPMGEPNRADPTVWGVPGLPSPVVVILQRYDQVAYRSLAATSPARVAAPGVLVLEGPTPSAQLAAAAPRANTRLRTMALVSVVVLALAWTAGSGWAVALLPPDPLLRVLLAPTLGVGAVAAAGIAWAGTGSGMTTAGAVAVSAVAILTGWLASGWRRYRRPAGAAVAGKSAPPAPEALAAPGPEPHRG